MSIISCYWNVFIGVPTVADAAESDVFSTDINVDAFVKTKVYSTGTNVDASVEAVVSITDTNVDDSCSSFWTHFTKINLSYSHCVLLAVFSAL